MIRKLYPILLIAFFLPFLSLAQAPCTTTNATGCVCATQGQTDCDLLPDITISKFALQTYLGGPTEYPQTGAGADNGRLRLSGSTPNIGFGPFTVGALQMWTCGTDTYTVFPGICPNGSEPKQLIRQKIYHKNGNTMTYWEHLAGSMTYHPTHGHSHVDDWAIFTLRLEDVNEPDPRNWPIVGDGAKVGFCLMDYGTCSYYNGHCRDSLDNILLNGDFPNYSLGGGNYGCSPVEQGISSGYTDIYSENLDGMWINIPPNTCNGDYWIVIEVDPHNNFMESREDNNWAAVPFTLTQQVPAGGGGVALVTPGGPTNLCAGDALTLTADPGNTYLWSNGETTRSIVVNQAGTYYYTVTNACGITQSDSVTVQVQAPIAMPTTVNDTLCTTGSASLAANGVGTLNWYTAPTGGVMVATGNTFNTPTLTQNTTYYVEAEVTTPGNTFNIGPVDNTFGTGSNFATTGSYLEFTAYKDFTLKTVKVYAQGAGNRTIFLSSAGGGTIQSAVVNIPDGQSIVTLNFNVPQAADLRLGVSSTPNLYRNNGGVAYPYNVAGVASITNSNAGANYYYFFYDWVIEELPSICSSVREPVEAIVNYAPAVSFSGLNASYNENDPIANLTPSPAGGFFTGPGISGNTFNPALAGAGGPYTITYIYTDGNGCSNQVTQNVTVLGPLNVIDDLTQAGNIIVYPNPASGAFTLSFELNATHQTQIRMLDLTGKEVMFRDLGNYSGKFGESIKVGHLAKGVYLVEVTIDEQKFYQKLIHN